MFRLRFSVIKASYLAVLDFSVDGLSFRAKKNSNIISICIPFFKLKYQTIGYIDADFQD